MFIGVNFIANAQTTNASMHTIAAGSAHSLYICSDSTVKAWGTNTYGQLGNGTKTSINIPVQVNTLTGITAVAAGVGYSLALKKDGTVWAWGSDAYGTNGIGNTVPNISISSPVQVNNLTGIIDISGGLNYALALKYDGTVWAWGDNTYGQIGNGNKTNVNAPVQVNGLTGVVAISAGGTSLALKNDGTLWGWGSRGGVGIGIVGPETLTPTQVPITGVTLIEAGTGHCLAAKNDGTVWAWGVNNYGQLGIGTLVAVYTPTQVIGLTNVIALTGGGGSSDSYSMAVKNDGTVWAWGWNGNGELGIGGINDQSTPVQVNALSNLTALTGGNDYSLAVKSDGTIWGWGSNYYGTLLNNPGGNAFPVQLNGVCQAITTPTVTPTNIINENTESAGISVFPNPTSSSITIDYGSNYLTMNGYTLKISNTLGQTVFTSIINQQKSNIDLSTYAGKGIYSVNIIDNAGHTIDVKKIILE